MVQDETLRKGVEKIMGRKAYYKDGSLNRKHIASIAFSDKSRLALLNALVHPAVIADAEAWHLAQQHTPYTLKEAALLFESGGYKHMNKIIMIFAPEALRLQRVMKRDGLREAAVRARMQQQMLDNEKIILSDYIIYNNNSTLLIPQIRKVHAHLVELSLTSHKE